MSEHSRYRAYTLRNLDELARRYPIPRDAVDLIRLYGAVLPFKVNDFVLSELIDWPDVPTDPIYQMVFPQPGMLTAEDERALRDVTAAGSPTAVRAVADRIQQTLNPHPSDQLENVPSVGGSGLPGVQHKYRETVLFFPQQGQTCHAYCTYCFRWPQFVPGQHIRFAAPQTDDLVRYLSQHPEVTDVLVTGGDPFVLSAALLRHYLEPILAVDTVTTIRLGTKALSYWPYTFTTDRDADEVLRVLETVTASGRTLALMAHFSHPRELRSNAVTDALRRVRSTGAIVFAQAPLMRHVNDRPETWVDLWKAEVAASVVPYYLFVARDTGPHGYYKVPLVEAHALFRDAYSRLPGLGRTVRGPVMSTAPGKIVLDGVDPEGRATLRFLQARDPSLVGRPFPARLRPDSAWIDDVELGWDVPADIRVALMGTVEQRSVVGVR